MTLSGDIKMVNGIKMGPPGWEKEMIDVSWNQDNFNFECQYKHWNFDCPRIGEYVEVPVPKNAKGRSMVYGEVIGITRDYNSEGRCNITVYLEGQDTGRKRI